MEYLFIYPKNLGRAGFFSQLEPIISYIGNKGHKCYAFFGYEEKSQVQQTTCEAVTTKAEYERVLAKADYIYTRNIYDFVPLYFKKLFSSKIHAKLIYNFRGFASYESYYGQKNPLKFLFFFIMEFLAYRLSDHVSVVSLVFKNELKKHYGGKKSVSITPCCVTDIYKKEGKVGDEIRFVYCGSTLKWQKFEETLSLYARISEKYDNTKLTLFTKDEEKAKKYISDNNIKNAEVKFLTRLQLLDELRNHDFGFLIRDNVMLNNVASPIKFAEYLSCGLMPIISKGVGDYTALVKDETLGLVAGESDVINFDEIEQRLKDPGIYNRIFNAANNLTWEHNLKDFPQ